MSEGRKGLLGIGIGVTAAVVATAAGFATDRVVRAKRAETEGGIDFTDVPDREVVVIGDDGVPLHVEIDEPEKVQKTSPTIVFTHGYTQNLQVWALQRRAIRDAGYRVVLWDLRGHGKSGEGDDASYTIDQLGRDLAAVIREAVPDGSVVLVGHSMGGMTMMGLAAQDPALLHERVIGAAFVSTSAGGLSSVNYGLGRQLGGIVHRLGPAAVTRAGMRQELFDQVRVAGKDIEAAMVQRYSFGGPVPAPLVFQVAEMIFATKLHVIGAYLPGLMAHDATEALSEFNGIETLVIHGTKDRLTPLQHSEAIVDRIPGAEYVIVTGAGHILPFEQPDVVNSELLQLISRAQRSIEARRPVRRRKVVKQVTGYRRRAGVGDRQEAGAVESEPS
ncbi:alpha/beta fold hydrolase [Rudaeicoccus suwonensis]|uniref:Pimeloyl-ACP methyl ester carboxylesterase n=1 Tax=Rudaeicoccus suwonensis TaxID=657409 RepID=A0A561E8D0_9MICO|nr:alpha/beta hydrolase [Rudaeicoccus suwonensis]TWE11882.1 pimeloyl-ACP methyl ester carboxylesterase [Rudaeicoccus suwonensis]